MDAACADASRPAVAGEPLFFAASCVDSVCCAGSAESCSTSYRPFTAEVWRRDGPAWVHTGLRVEPAGECGSTPRYVVTPPGGTLRLDGITVDVQGDAARTPTAWPPGFPALDDGLHERVLAPTGSAAIRVDGLDEALQAAGWRSVAGGWTFRGGVLVRFDGRSLTWSTHHVPADRWWNEPEACPSGSTLLEGDLGREHACMADDREGPYTRVGDGALTTGAYLGGERDGDWLELRSGYLAIRSYARGVPVGDWVIDGYPERTAGRYVDGAKDGTWTTTAAGPQGLPVTVVEDWCLGVSCGGWRKTWGPVVEVGAYRDGERSGAWWTTNEGEAGPYRTFEGTFAAGRAVGVHRTWQGPGELLTVKVWDEDGREHGIWLDYDWRGRVERRDVYRRGELVRSRAWVDDGFGGLRRARE